MFLCCNKYFLWLIKSTNSYDHRCNISFIVIRKSHDSNYFVIIQQKGGKDECGKGELPHRILFMLFGLVFERKGVKKGKNFFSFTQKQGYVGLHGKENSVIWSPRV